jgi:hypothetical protein
MFLAILDSAWAACKSNHALVAVFGTAALSNGSRTLGTGAFDPFGNLIRFCELIDNPP